MQTSQATFAATFYFKVIFMNYFTNLYIIENMFPDLLFVYLILVLHVLNPHDVSRTCHVCVNEI